MWKIFLLLFFTVQVFAQVTGTGEDKGGHPPIRVTRVPDTHSTDGDDFLQNEQNLKKETLEKREEIFKAKINEELLSNGKPPITDIVDFYYKLSMSLEKIKSCNECKKTLHEKRKIMGIVFNRNILKTLHALVLDKKFPNYLMDKHQVKLKQVDDILYTFNEVFKYYDYAEE